MTVSKYLQTIPTGNPVRPYQLAIKTYHPESGEVSTVALAGFFATAKKADKQGVLFSEQLFVPHLSESCNAIIDSLSEDGRTYTLLKISPDNTISSERTFNLSECSSTIAQVSTQYRDKSKNLFIHTPPTLRFASKEDFKILTGQVKG